jgi:hypothetical protein
MTKQSPILDEGDCFGLRPRNDTTWLVVVHTDD